MPFVPSPLMVPQVTRSDKGWWHASERNRVSFPWCNSLPRERDFGEAGDRRRASKKAGFSRLPKDHATAVAHTGCDRRVYPTRKNRQEHDPSTLLPILWTVYHIAGSRASATWVISVSHVANMAGGLARTAAKQTMLVGIWSSADPLHLWGTEYGFPHTWRRGGRLPRQRSRAILSD